MTSVRRRGSFLLAVAALLLGAGCSASPQSPVKVNLFNNLGETARIAFCVDSCDDPSVRASVAVGSSYSQLVKPGVPATWLIESTSGQTLGCLLANYRRHVSDPQLDLSSMIVCTA